MTHTSGCYYSL